MNFTTVEELMVASNQSLPAECNQPLPHHGLLPTDPFVPQSLNPTNPFIPQSLNPTNPFIPQSLNPTVPQAMAIHVPVHGHLFQDVHQFDYSYKDQPFVCDMTDDEKIKWIHAIKSRMTNPIAQHGVDLILANVNQNANLDLTNQKRAEDLLAVLSKHMDTDPNLLSLLEEQLQDMVQLGQCAQGRTTRLWQIYNLLSKEGQ
jgi:septum formation topological specificity factor MinE